MIYMGQRDCSQVPCNVVALWFPLALMSQGVTPSATKPRRVPRQLGRIGALRWC